MRRNRWRWNSKLIAQPSRILCHRSTSGLPDHKWKSLSKNQHPQALLSSPPRVVHRVPQQVRRKVLLHLWIAAHLLRSLSRKILCLMLLNLSSNRMLWHRKSPNSIAQLLKCRKRKKPRSRSRWKRE